jgi:alkaline phosphatase
MQEQNLQEQVPTLAEMTQKAIDLMKGNPKGFVMQVEGGKVDWAAHANDPAALLYDQIAFDEAIGVALDFAEKDKNTLVIVTTDHGNANPGLFYGKEADKNFDKIQKFRYSNDWVLQSIKKDMRAEQVVELIEFAQGIVFKKAEAEELLAYYRNFQEEGTYNSYKLPFRKMAELQVPHISISWAGIDHSADFVELTAFGPGAEALKPFVKNYELHNWMLRCAGLPVK